MNHKFKLLSAFALLGTFLLCRQALSAELEAIQWKSGEPTETLTLILEEATEHRTESLDDGQRLRVVLPDTRLGEGVSDMPGQGMVKSVFPFVAEDRQSVNVDLLLTEPGRLEITQTGEGLDVVARAGAGGGSQQSSEDMEPARAASTNALNGINFASLPGGRIQVNLSMSRRPEQPAHFSTNRPPRLAFDFLNTRNDLDTPESRCGSRGIDFDRPGWKPHQGRIQPDPAGALRHADYR